MKEGLAGHRSEEEGGEGRGVEECDMVWRIVNGAMRAVHRTSTMATMRKKMMDSPPTFLSGVALTGAGDDRCPKWGGKGASEHRSCDGKWRSDGVMKLRT